MSTNAAASSVAVAAQQAEQFGAFLSLYAQKNNLTVPNISIVMPASVSVSPLEMNSALLAGNEVEPDTIDDATTNNATILSERGGRPATGSSEGPQN
ncbi:hypothetical protein BWQ96_07441 [Gracilariopsis chorda]|uniref:Uncharacterized protein n=1 Tax=Gracilariopsis chorda TaxID=448386 RepID=A0A2V3ILC9_9FLOR|nr:hypothetical protein BWQ96_07441 [Gracilariopsis chorda]|eukprot:PXF42847.1 hypothetical protein BWQ96_07441 [Gracilariopsis chorda]